MAGAGQESDCLEDNMGKKELALRIIWGKGAGGWVSTQTGRLRGDVRRCVHMWTGVPGRPPERSTCKGRVGSQDRALQLIDLVRKPLRRHLKWKDSWRD